LPRTPSASILPCLFAWAVVGFFPAARAAEKPAPFSLSYVHAGLSEITVKDGKLHYIWHTERQSGDGKAALDRSGLENYDRHQVDVWLTDKELEQFRAWQSEAPLGVGLHRDAVEVCDHLVDGRLHGNLTVDMEGRAIDEIPIIPTAGDQSGIRSGRSVASPAPTLW
jgi:hypothetical protein